jgi:hypothetical protein
MSATLPALRFFGHGGERYQPKNAVNRVMFIPDASLFFEPAVKVPQRP